MNSSFIIFAIILFLLSLLKDGILLKIITRLISVDFKTFYKRIFLLLILYSSSRILFYAFNSEYFSSNIPGSILEGIRFDISALLYINIPLLILLMFPSNIRKKISYKRITNIIFYCINIPFLLVNNADIEYYKFSLKRTTADIFDYLSLGSGQDALVMIPQYLIDYWYITMIIIVQIGLLIKIKKIPSDHIKSHRRSIPLFILSIGIFILGVRGGTQLKPIKMNNAGVLTNTNNSALVLNSPFCILHTFFEEELEQYDYFETKEANEIYNTSHHFQDNNPTNKNVVIIILESFSKEFIGHYNQGNGYTPFLDTLLQHSLVIENGYSNGIKSIEALPAITSSIPTLMDNPFITSPYATNKYHGIGKILKDEGYATSFFHGGKKGTMGFYAFSKRAGFDKYFGMEEYNNTQEIEEFGIFTYLIIISIFIYLIVQFRKKNTKHILVLLIFLIVIYLTTGQKSKNMNYDGSWGIYDEPFFNYYADYLKDEQEPFISCIFSVSSHPPFVIPEKYKNKFPEGNLGIHKTIRYTDFALRKFFKSAKKEDWYKNTLFVITADHTSPESDKIKYKNKIGRYSIPIAYFMGDSSLQGNDSVISQQIDIMPTILEMIGYNKKFFSFGKSISNQDNWAISYINNEYLFIHKDGFLIGREEKYTNFLEKDLRKEVKADTNIIRHLKSIKQRYNNNLIKNQLTIHED